MTINRFMSKLFRYLPGFLFLALGLIVAISLFADDAAPGTAVAVTGLAKLLPLGLMLGKTLMKTVGAGLVLKFILGWKIGGDELIHRVPEGIRPLVTSILAILIFIPYVIWGGAYDCATCDVQLQADLVGVLGAGSTANVVHDTLATWKANK